MAELRVDVRDRSGLLLLSFISCLIAVMGLASSCNAPQDVTDDVTADAEALDVPKGIYVTAIDAQTWRFEFYAGPTSAETIIEGELVSTVNPVSFVKDKFETEDVLELTGTGRLHYRTVVSVAYDAFLVKYPAGQSGCLTTSDSSISVYVGAAKTKVPTPFNLATLQPCGGPPPSADVWSSFSVTTSTLTVAAKEPLKVNSPFVGIEVQKNGIDITDDIVKIESLSDTSWRYTFATQVLNAPGATINVSLQNRAVASPGHYLAVSDGKLGTVQGLYQALVDCEAGQGDCAGRGAVPGLVAAVKGMSVRYSPREIEASQGVYDFSAVFNDAAFLASKGKRLHVIFTVKSFGKNMLYDGTGSRTAFDIPRGKSGWDGGRNREVHVYVKDGTGQFKETKAFVFNGTRTQVVLSSPPSAGTKNVLVVYSRDPFPEYTWQMNPPIAGWYDGAGGQNTDTALTGGSHGFVNAPWRATTVKWMRNFMAAFQSQWDQAIDNGLADSAIESISIQETANALSETDPTYSVVGYRAGLFEYAKFNARATRRRALHGQLFNIIPGGNKVQAMAALSKDIILWGARLEGPDLFNNEPALENNVYENVHRAFHDQAMNMIWHQNASYSEHIGTSNAFYTPAQQYIKAQRGVTDTSTPSGTPGLEAEYVFWNMTLDAPLNSPQRWVDALPTIAKNPVIQVAGNDRYLWRRQSDGKPIGDQSLSKVNP